MSTHTKTLIAALCCIAHIARTNYEQDPKLRANSARTLKRIADRADEALEQVARGEKS